MQVSQDSSSLAEFERAKKRHEAKLIPGVDGFKIFGFPNSIITKLRYCDQYPLTSTLGARGLNVFAANGIFDPDLTGIGHQPLYRDQYAGVYDNYVVLGSKITATFAARASGVNFAIGIVGDNDSTISTTVSTLLEQNNSVWTMAGVPGSGVRTLVATFGGYEDLGVDVEDDGASATSVGANPNDVWTYAIWAASMDNSTAICDVIVEIDYTVKFMQLSTQAQN